MKELRLVLAMPLLIPIFLGLLIIYIFGIPFMAIGGKKSYQIFEAITEMVIG